MQVDRIKIFCYKLRWKNKIKNDFQFDFTHFSSSGAFWIRGHFHYFVYLTQYGVEKTKILKCLFW